MLYFHSYRLFEIAPHLQDLFSFQGEELNESNEKLKQHAVQVMSSVGAAIDIIEDEESLEDVLTGLGIVHHMKSVKVDSFGVSKCNSIPLFILLSDPGVNLIYSVSI